MAFVLSPRNYLVNCDQSAMTKKRILRTRRYSFFKDMMDQAFQNDRNLSEDKRKGQYDDIFVGDEFVEDNPRQVLTETQKKWRGTQGKNDVTPEMLENKKSRINLYLAGVSARDPSSDLYARKVNISSRDKATGLSLPNEPSASLTITLLENGVCRASSSEFTSGEKEGEWKLSDDGKMLRFSMDAIGYTRTVQTKGSIQKIYWSDEEEVSLQTSSSSSIPPGWVYGDVPIQAGRQPGTFDFGGDGLLQIEQKMGLLGVATKMVPCGKFQAQMEV
jgi:hypothetical protein